MIAFFDWAKITIKRLLERDSAIFLRAVHASTAESFERAITAARSYYPNSCPDDALPQLAADAFLPTFTGEPPANVRARLLARNDILDEVGTLRGMARIVQMYFPNSARVIVFSRQGYWAVRTSAGVLTQGYNPAFDYDSSAFGGTVPDERLRDTYIAIEGPYDFSFTTTQVLQPGQKVKRISECVGLTGSVAAGIFEALRTAVTAHRQLITTVPAMVLLDPSAPSGTYWNPSVDASLPSGLWGRASTRPTIHRYIGGITRDL